MKEENLFLKNYKNLKVLITGTTGFKGSWLAFWLQELGAKVVGIGLRPEKNFILYESLNLRKRTNQYFFDICNFNKLDAVIKKEKPDIIFHLAAQSIVSTSFKNPLDTFNTNIIGSANVLESFRLNNIHSLVYVTSDKCYLNLNKKKRYKETDPLGGLDNYSSSKASAELIFMSYFNNYFNKKKYLNVASARAGNVIGGGDMKENRIIPDIIRALYYKKKLKLRHANATRPWQHVLECIYGYLLLGHKLLNDDLKIKTVPNWNFGPKIKNQTTVEYITNEFLKNWGKNNLKISKKESKRFFETKFLSLNIQKAKKELNWQPRLDLKSTINLTADWYKHYFKYKNNKIEFYTNEQIQYFLDK